MMLCPCLCTQPERPVPVPPRLLRSRHIRIHPPHPTLTTPHPTHTPPTPGAISLAALSALSDGPRAMRGMLELALPGIDANDPRKMLLTLHVVDQLLLVASLSAPEPDAVATVSAPANSKAHVKHDAHARRV